MAACPKFSSLASVLASGLSAFLGEGPLAADTWQWVEKFVELHYGYKLPEDARSRLRKLEVLRGLCHKVRVSALRFCCFIGRGRAAPTKLSGRGLLLQIVSGLT